MASRFILHLSAELVQPNKQALLSLTNLLWHSEDMKHGYMKYNFLQGRSHLQSYVLNGRTTNLEVLNTVLLRDELSARTIHEVLQEREQLPNGHSFSSTR